MKPAPFEYHRPESLDEALELLAEHGDEAKPLAGGQSLVPLLAMRLAQPAHLVDLNRVSELAGWQHQSGGVRLGALVRHATLENPPTDLQLPEVVPTAVRHIGHVAIRNRGTVGGSIAHADPAAEWPALLLALDGTVTARSSRGERSIPAADLFLGPLMTAIEPDELLTDVELRPRGGRGAFAEIERRHGDFALVGAVCDSGRVAVFGTASRAQRLTEVEVLVADGVRDPREIAATAERQIEAGGDVHASAAYRRKVGGRLVAEVVGRCLS